MACETEVTELTTEGAMFILGKYLEYDLLDCTDNLSILGDREHFAGFAGADLDKAMACNQEILAVMEKALGGHTDRWTLEVSLGIVMTSLLVIGVDQEKGRHELVTKLFLRN